MSRTILLALLALLPVSCIPDPIEVKNIPKVEPQIVVSSQIIPGQVLVVWLTRTFGALNAGEDSDPEEVLKQLVVNDAIVTLTGPARTDTLQFLGAGVYSAPGIPFKAGEHYELQVNSETLGEVSASTRVQDPVSFRSIEGELLYDFYDDPLLQVSYSIHDPAEQNQYMVNAQKFELDTVDFMRKAINPNAFTLLFEDTEFNGLPIELHFDFSLDDYAAGDTILVSLSNISEDYYHFMKLRRENRLDFIQFLSDPVNYPTNVTGGKGFFNLYIPDFRTLVVD